MSAETKTGTYTNVYGESVMFNFKTSLSAVDKVRFVNIVTDSIVGDNYYSIIKELIFKFAVIDVFTDIDTSSIWESDDIVSNIEEFVNSTFVADVVIQNAEDGLIEELIEAVELNIEYKTGIHRNPIAESLGNLLNTLENKIASIDMDGMMEMAKSISDISGDLTPEKILDAYAKTDMYKQHWSAKANASDDQKSISGAATPVLSPTFEV